MTSKIHNFVFRDTVTPSGWASITSATSPTDVTQDTVALYKTGANTYPQTSAGGMEYGFSSGVLGFSFDYTTTQGGNNLLLAGGANWSSTQHFQIDIHGAGTYNFKIAFGSSSGSITAQQMIVYEGSFDTLLYEISTPNPAINGAYASAIGGFVASTVVTVISPAVVVADKSIWIVTIPGTTGTTPPSISASTNGIFTDNGVTWKRTSRDVLGIFSGTSDYGLIINQNSTTAANTTWSSSAPLSINISGSHGNCITVSHLVPAGTGWSFPIIRAVSVQQASTTLADVTTYDDLNQVGTSTGTTPTVYAMQPPGVRAFRILAPTGRLDTTTATFSGPMGTYFTPKFYNGQLWAESNNTPLPDSLATDTIANRTLIVTQNDSEVSVSSRSTTLICGVVSSLGKPTDKTVFGLASTPAYLSYRKVKDEWTARGWVPPSNPTFSTDVLVTSAIAFKNAYANAAADNSWHRIRIGIGTFDGYTTPYGTIAGGAGTSVIGVVDITKDWGTNGGMLIEPDSGGTSNFNLALSGHVRGLYVRNLIIPGDMRKTWGLSDAGNYISNRMFIFTDPYPATNTYLNRVKLEGLKCGLLNTTGYTIFDVDGSGVISSGFVSAAACESLEIINCSIKGISYGINIGNSRVARFAGNDFQAVWGDTYNPKCVAGFQTTLLNAMTQYSYTNNDTFLLFEDEVYRNTVDYTNYNSGEHADNIQINPMNGTSGFYGINNRDGFSTVLTTSSNIWTAAVGNYSTGQAICMAGTPPALYQVVSVQAGPNGEAAGQASVIGSGPTGHGQSIVDGGITWKWIQDYNFQGVTNLALVGCTGDTSAPSGGKTIRQWLIDSNYSCNNIVNWTSLDCIYLTNSDKGLRGIQVNAYIEYCTNAGVLQEETSAARSNQVSNYGGLLYLLEQYHFSFSNGFLRARKNRTLKASGSGTTKTLNPYNSYDEQFIETNISKVTSSTLLTNHMRGPFAAGTNVWHAPTLTYDGSNSRQNFKDTVRNAYQALPVNNPVGILPSSGVLGINWIANTPIISTATGGTALIFSNLTAGTSRMLSGAAIDSGYITANNIDPLQVTAPVKGLVTPTFNATLSFSLTQTLNGFSHTDNFSITVVA